MTTGGHAIYNEMGKQGENDLVTQHAPLVKRIAYHMLNKLPPNVQVDDLIQSGMIGLLEAARQYDSSQGASFSTYAGIRIRGAMLDEMRRLDWTPRSVHKKARGLAEAMRDIENKTGRDPKDNEIAAAMGISMEDYYQILRDSNASRVFSYDQDEINIGGDQMGHSTATPENMLEDASFKAALVECIKELPERDQIVMSLYYDEEMNLKEIGAVLGVSESRVSQIHARITLKLRSRMQDWLNTTD